MFYKEEEVRVVPYKVKAICEECIVGELIPTGISKATNPPKFEHKCSDCGYTLNIRDKYPIIRFKEVHDG